MKTLSDTQIRAAIAAGIDDATEAVQESGDQSAPSGGWDSWLINSAGVRAVERLSGETADSDGWRMWLRIYHQAACVAAERGVQ